MNITNFARIRNAKPLLLTEEKRVLHFPKTNKVRIDNIGSDVPEYRQADLRSSRREYVNADAASKLGVVPAVQNYRERGNLQTYTQDYAGKALPRTLRGIAPKEQYKLGSQVGRIQNRLREQNLGHADIHEGNIARPNPKRSKVQLIDNDAIKTVKNKYDEAEIKNMYDASIHSLGKPIMTGYNSRINFTQQKQMQHFANFATSSDANFSLTNLGAVGAVLGARTGLGAGAVYGLARGMGAGESQEEKDSTTALGRVGKILGRTATGSIAGAGIGTVAGGTAAVGYGQLRRKNQGFDKWADKVGLTSEKNWDDRIAAVRARKNASDLYANTARQSGQAPSPNEID
jgi:hypothetical protein